MIEALGRIQQEIAQISTEEPLCPRSLGLSSYKPAKSCREIIQCNPPAQSGYYWLKSTTTESQEVYCAMDTTYCNITGVWMRLGYFNMSEPGISCPASLRQINTPTKLCGQLTAPGCSGVSFPTDGIHYSKVCGQARGHQYHSPDGFGQSSNDINSAYVDDLLSHTGPLVSISGHMQLDFLMITITQVGSTTVPVPHPQVETLLLLLGWITTTNLESLVGGKTTDELLLKTHCGTVMDVVQPTTAAIRLGCRVSTGPSHRKW